MTLFEKGLLLYFFILFILWLWVFNTRGDRKLDKRHNLSNVKSERSNWVNIFKSAKYLPSVNKKEFINAVVSWGIINLSYEGLSEKRKSVDVEISYYRHKKMKGCFSSHFKKILVYVNNHESVDDLINTALHEVVHFFQYCSDKRNYEKNYYKLLKEKSYSYHPMEIEAVAIAAAYTNDCKKYLVEKGILRINNKKN
jgi:hypothetical protein